MVSNFCGNCGNTVSGNFCGDCGYTVRATKYDRNMMERNTGINEKLDPDNRTQFDLIPQRVPDRNFTAWLLLMLLMPFWQIVYISAVMKDFKDYLWPRLQADSKLELDSKEVKVRSPTFYVMILTMPAVVLIPYILFLNLSSSYLIELVGENFEKLSDVNTGMLIILVIALVIVPVVIVLLSPLAPLFYIYHKHIILSQFIDLRYGTNAHNSEYPVVNPSIFKVRQKPLIYLGTVCASVIGFVIAFVILITNFSYRATLIAGVIAILIWVIPTITWFFYEKMWHDTMYELIRFESSMEINYLIPAPL